MLSMSFLERNLFFLQKLPLSQRTWSTIMRHKTALLFFFLSWYKYDNKQHYRTPCCFQHGKVHFGMVCIKAPSAPPKKHTLASASMNCSINQACLSCSELTNTLCAKILLRKLACYMARTWCFCIMKWRQSFQMAGLLRSIDPPYWNSGRLKMAKQPLPWLSLQEFQQQSVLWQCNYISLLPLQSKQFLVLNLCYF